MTIIAPNLSVQIKDRTFSRIVQTPLLKFEILEYLFNVDGGPKSCTLKATGDLMALQALFAELRDELKLIDGSSADVWWGCLWSVEITDGKFKYGYTLDGMGNKINMLYTQQTINQAYSGGGTAAETGFSSDTDSIGDYGTKELRLRSGNLSATAALAERAKQLADLSTPYLDVKLEAGAGSPEPSAMIICKGWIETLEWRYWLNNSGAAAGFERNDVTTSEVSQLLGMAQPARTSLVFTANGFIEDTTAGMLLSTITPYNHFFLEGAASNSNIAWQVLTSTEPGRKVTVTPTTVSTEAAGASVVIKHVGQQIKQIITLPTNNPFYAAAIDIRLQKFGSPTDNVLVQLYTVSGGLPNVLLATGTITPAEAPTSIGWVTATLDALVFISFGTDYIIKISRSGSAAIDCYLVGLDTGLNYTRGAMQLYTNATLGWVNRLVNADLIFRVAGVVETTTQITNIIAGVGESFTGVDIEDASGQYALPYADGTQTARKIIANLLKAGSSDSKWMFARVTPDRRLVIYKEPTRGGPGDFVLDRQAVPMAKNETDLARHTCPHGQWAYLKPLEYAPAMIALARKYVFIEETAYKPNGNELRVTKIRNRRGENSILGVTV